MDLDKCREEIDQIDDQIRALLNKRFSIAKELAAFKKKITDKKRENDIFAKIESKNIKSVFKTIIKNSKKIQKETVKNCCSSSCGCKG